MLPFYTGLNEWIPGGGFPRESYSFSFVLKSFLDGTSMDKE